MQYRRLSFIPRLLAALAVLLVIGGAYMLLWPVSIDPLEWSSPKSPGYAGPFAVNNQLSHLKHIVLNGEDGPEHIALGPDGLVYVAVASGRILRMTPDGRDIHVVANTGGRVLGFDFDKNGNIIAADALKGLLKVGQDGRVTVLVREVHAGDFIRYADGVVVAPSGTIYFTDASTRHAPEGANGTLEASLLEILEQRASGRVLAFDPQTARTWVVARGFSFANGIALSADGQSLFVAESGRYRVWTVNVRMRDGDVQRPSPMARVLIDNLPGYPDNLMRGKNGKIWLGLAKPRTDKADGLNSRPFLKRMVLRLPRALWPVPQAYGHVLAFNEQGQIVADLQDPTGAYPETTGVLETSERLYIQSLHAKTVAWLMK